MKVAVVAPAGIVTEAGGVVCPLEADSATVRPPVGAAPLIVTVPVVLLPPSTVVGFNVSETTVGGVTVNVAVAVVVPTVPVIVEGVLEATGVVVTVNAPVVLPAATVTVAGTVADEELEDRPTEKPPVGAGPLSVTVPVEETPPMTDVGATLTALTVGGTIVKVAELVLVPRVAVIEAGVLVATPVVVIVNVPVIDPDGTVTVAGTVAAALLDVRLTTVPPVPAVAPSVTVPVDDVPPVTDVGLTATATVLAGCTVRAAEAEPPFAAAVMFPVTSAVVVVVVTVKFAVEAPAGTETVAGTVALAFADVSVTVTGSLAPAAGVIVTVPVEGAGPTTVFGFRVTAVTTGAVTVNVALFEVPFAVAVIAGVWLLLPR